MNSECLQEVFFKYFGKLVQSSKFYQGMRSIDFWTPQNKLQQKTWL